MEGHPAGDELDQARKDGTMREGNARIHPKLFPKYGFLIPENPLYHGETIFFGLTAHVDASKKYISDLREELFPDQRVKYMAVRVERDGTEKWKALVVSPLPSDQQDTPTSVTEGHDENEHWLTCTVHYNLQTTHGFATPDGGNPYHDNVYFSLKEASDGLETTVTDLTTVFTPGEAIKALVVPAGARFKAKYRALKIRKIAPQTTSRPVTSAVAEKPPGRSEDCLLVEEVDQAAVSWFYELLESKGSIKLTSLAGDLSHNIDVRSVVQPQKKSLKRFLAKYPRFFSVKEDTVCLVPDCPPLKFEPKNKSPSLDFVPEGLSSARRSSEDGSTTTSSTSPPSPLPDPGHNLKSLVDMSSPFTRSMLASIVRSQKEPMRMSEVSRVCQQYGWEAMKTVALAAEVVANNSKYFTQNERSCLVLTDEGFKLPVVKLEKIYVMKNSADNMRAQSSESLDINKGGQVHSSSGSAFSAFSSVPLSNRQAPTTVATTSLGLATSEYNYRWNRKAYTPVGANLLGGGISTSFEPFEPETPDDAVEGLFPSGSILSPSASNGMSGLGNGYVYQSESDTESTDDKFKPHDKMVSSAHCNEEESQFLSVIARGICPNAIGGSEEVFKMLQKALEDIGITLSESESCVLSRHLLCVQLDIGRKPRAIFQAFTPSGKLSQTTVTLSAEEVSDKALRTMLSETHPNVKITRVGLNIYGIKKTYHFVRKLTNSLDQVCGCTVSFRMQQEAPDVRVSDLLQLGDRGKVKIILTDGVRGTTSSSACASMRQYATEKCANASLIVVDMEGQIFGYGNNTYDVRRLICGGLDMQQQQLKEVAHHHPNIVIVNAVDCVETLNLLKRINARGIGIYAEVAKSLERNVRNVFEDFS